MNDINQTFAHFRNGLDAAPERMFTNERVLRAFIGAAVDDLIRQARLLGLAPCNSDGAHNVEATIYAWLTKDSTFGAAVEGLGEYGDPHHYYAERN